MLRYILYARKSSEEKTKQVQSIEDQVHALLPLIDQGRLHVVHTLTESRSAKAPGRPVFNQMLDLINKGQAAFNRTSVELKPIISSRRTATRRAFL